MDRRGHFVVLFFFAVIVSCLFAEGKLPTREKRQQCDYPINSEDVVNKTVVAHCRYYGDRFYECTAWNRLLARNHWIDSDRIIPREKWINHNERVRIAECKFYDNKQYRCRQTPQCIGTVCERKCPWGGKYEGTPQAGFKRARTEADQS